MEGFRNATNPYHSLRHKLPIHESDLHHETEPLATQAPLQRSCPQRAFRRAEGVGPLTAMWRVWCPAGMALSAVSAVSAGAADVAVDEARPSARVLRHDGLDRIRPRPAAASPRAGALSGDSAPAPRRQHGPHRVGADIASSERPIATSTAGPYSGSSSRTNGVCRRDQAGEREGIPLG